MHPRRIALLLVAACGSGGTDSMQPDADSDALDDAAPTPGAPYRIMANPKLAASTAIKNRVIVIGTQQDGSPALDDIVMSFDRPGAGTYTRSAVKLGNLGATTYFSGCDLATPGCAGPLKLTAALASAPTTPVATLDVELVDPIEVNPAKPCLGGGNVLYLKGNDQIFNGEVTITNATWTITSPYPEYLVMTIAPASGGSWSLAFDSRSYAPFHVPDAYENAYRSTAAYPDPEFRDRPAMNIKNPNAECTTIFGRYDVMEPFTVNSSTADFTIAFEQYCNGAPSKVLTGCVRYQQ